MQPPIYILGVSPRSGTNFLFDLLRLHPAVGTPGTVEEDFLLFGADHLKEYVAQVSRRWDIRWGMSGNEPSELLQSMAAAGLEFLRRRQADAGQRLLTKTPEVRNLSLLFELFPEAQPIIIVRDGRAVVESKMKSFDAEFARAGKAWAEAAQSIIDFTRVTPPDRFRLVRYEDLYRDTHEVVRALLVYLNLDPERYPFDRIDDLPVRGSSAHFGASGELDWNPIAKPETFNPLERFSHWSARQHIEFNVLAGEQMKWLGYELREPVFQRVEFNRARFDEQTDLLTRPDNGARVLMPWESADLLWSMDSFDGLHGHFLRSQLEAGELPRFVEFCDTCARSGFLQSREEFLAAVTEEQANEPPTELFGIFIRTCERPQYLERILATLARPRGAAAGRIFVLDDSRSAESRQANAAIVERWQAAGAVSVSYLGIQWQRDFINRLTTSFPDYEGVIRYLLEPRPGSVFSAGRVLNLAMLAFAGKRLLTYDDDYIVDSCWQHPEVQNDLLHVGGERAFCLQGYGSGADIAAANRDLQRDPVAEHAGLLGAPLSHLLKRPGSDVPWDIRVHGLNRVFARKLHAGSRILTTGNGVMGQPIAPDGTQGWFADGYTTVPVWAGGKDYAHWIAGEQVFASARCATVAPTTYGIPVGIDNSQLMPPTLPEGRREDSLFTFLLHHIHPTAVHYEFPWAIRHEREPLDWRRVTVEQPQAMALAQFIMLSLQTTLSPRAERGSPETALLTLGATLGEVSATPDPVLAASTLSQFQSLASQHHARLSDALDRPDLHDPAVRADLERALQVSRECQSVQPARVFWEDKHCPAGQGAQLHWVRQNLLLFGHALLVWPLLWSHCKERSEFGRQDPVIGSEVPQPQKTAEL